MLTATVSTGLSTANLIEIVLAAAAVATVAGAWWRRHQDDQRRSWRSQDRSEGYRDGNGNLHRGANDVVLGWDDENGHHLGLDLRFSELERRFNKHVSDGHGRDRAGAGANGGPG